MKKIFLYFILLLSFFYVSANSDEISPIKKDFGEIFIKLARGVYFNNDNRAKIKSDINKLLGSDIKEIKQYVEY